MSKTTQEVPNAFREELATTIITQARTDSELFDELASNIADVLGDGDEENEQSIASQILGMKAPAPQRSILDIVYLTSTISLTFLWLMVNITAMLYGNGNVILRFNHYNEGWPEVIMFSLIGGYGVLTVYRTFRR